MKKITFSRKLIFRAIHAACVALFLLAAQREAQAQSFTAPFQVSGSTVTTSSGTYGNGAGLYEPGAGYTSLTIGAGTTINATTPYGGSGSYDINPYSLVTTSASSFSNAGSITLNGTNGSGSGAYQATVFLSQGATSITATNSGTISSQLHGGNVTQALEFVSTTGNITVTNSGTLTAGSSNSAYVLEALSNTSGNIAITNTANGSISTSIAGKTIYVRTMGAGTIDFTNAGTLSATGGINGDGVLFSSQAGDIQASNTGTITGTNRGLNLFSQTGNVSVTNGGSVTGTASTAIGASSNSGDIFVTNSGTVTTSNEGIGAETNTGRTTVINSGTVNGGSYSGIYAGGANVSVTNSGTVTNSASAIYAEQESGTGTVQVVNNGMITNSGSGIYVLQFGNGSIQVVNNNTIATSTNGIVIQSNAGQPVTVTNSGSISVTNTGIQLSSPGTIMDSGPISGGVAAINVPSGSSVTLSGRPTISGTVIGGATSASTSQLTFALNIPAANLAAAKTQLNTEIAAYDAQNGGNYTFTIDGLTYDISNFDYTNITDDLATVINRLYANTPGYQSMGTVLDNLPAGNAAASRLLTALGNVSDPGLVNALSELSPKSLEIFSNVADNVATFNAAKINNHLANRRDGLTGFDATALNVQDSSMDPTLNQVRDHLLAYNPVATPGLMSDTVDSLFGGMDMKNTQVNTMPSDRWSSFIAGDVILADLSHNANLEDANYTTGNVTAGLDYRLDDHFTVGALFAYSHTDADLDSRGGSATVDSYSPGIYASYVDKGWYGNGLATYGRNAYTSDRVVDIPGLQGDNHGGTSGNQGTLNLTGGYEFQKGSFKFGPLASVQYVHLSLDSMQEQGPTALSIDSQDQDSFRSQLGVEGRFVADINTPVGPVSLTPHVSLSWQHEYLDSSRGINAQFTGTGGGSFVTQTDNPDRDAAFIDVGLDATVTKNITLFVDYETQAGQNNFFAQSAEGGVKIGF